MKLFSFFGKLIYDNYCLQMKLTIQIFAFFARKFKGLLGV